MKKFGNVSPKACFIYLAILLIFLVWVSVSNAADYRVYLETGGMNVTENQISEGHKSYHLLGVEGEWEINNWSNLRGNIDAFLRGEAAEEDPEIWCGGAGAGLEWIFKAGWIDPYLGVRYEHLTRASAWKYTNPDDGEYDAEYAPQHETEFDLVMARGGLHFVKDWFWADLGTIIPFYSSSKSGNFGPDLGIGFTWKSFDVGYRFKEIRLTDHHFESGDGDMSFYWSGVQIGYTF
jgi:hypothetical protein